MTDEERIINILENTDFHFSEESDPEGITAQNFCTAYNKAIDIVEKYSKLKEAIEKIEKDIKEWYWNADKQAVAKDPCVVDAMTDMFIRTIDKHTEGLI